MSTSRRCPASCARHHGVAAGEGADAERDAPGVAEDALDGLVVDLQLVGDDLGQHRARALALWGGARVDGHLPGRVDAHARALERARARGLVVDADAQPDQAALGPGGLLLLGERGVIHHREGLVQRGREVAAVEDDRGLHRCQSGVEGHLLRPDEVATAQVGAVDAQLPRGDVDQPLAGEARLGRSRPAVRGGGALVRGRADDVDVDVRDVVEPGEAAARERGVDHC